MSLVIRPAQKEDGVIAACLLADTMGEFGVEVLGLGKPELQIKALHEWFTDEKNRFSYEHTLIAEKYGAAAGLVLAFSGAKLDALELGCGRRIFHIYGFPGAFRMIWRNKALVNNREVERDEYLIAHLAVDANLRRQGIAQALMARAEDDARTHGLTKLVLEVEIGNDKAFALYLKSGFEVVNTVYFNQKASKFKCPGFYKMLKNL
jgi:ribosomal protein S18 acetylase RimI-like enzyme